MTEGDGMHSILAPHLGSRISTLDLGQQGQVVPIPGIMWGPLKKQLFSYQATSLSISPSI